MEKTVYMSLLLDYYGELLTEKQKEYCDLYYNENLSLSEIAENDGITRQGVRDSLVRAEAAMQEAEKKLRLMEQAEARSRKLAEADRLLAEIARLNATRFKNGALLHCCNAMQAILGELQH